VVCQSYQTQVVNPFLSSLGFFHPCTAPNLLPSRFIPFSQANGIPQGENLGPCCPVCLLSGQVLHAAYLGSSVTVCTSLATRVHYSFSFPSKDALGFPHCLGICHGYECDSCHFRIATFRVGMQLTMVPFSALILVGAHEPFIGMGS
jgi:hypothetical protein